MPQQVFQEVAGYHGSLQGSFSIGTRIVVVCYHGLSKALVPQQFLLEVAAVRYLCSLWKASPLELVSTLDYVHNVVQGTGVPPSPSGRCLISQYVFSTLSGELLP